MSVCCQPNFFIVSFFYEPCFIIANTDFQFQFLFSFYFLVFLKRNLIRNEKINIFFFLSLVYWFSYFYFYSLSVLSFNFFSTRQRFENETLFGYQNHSFSTNFLWFLVLILFGTLDFNFSNISFFRMSKPFFSFTSIFIYCPYRISIFLQRGNNFITELFLVSRINFQSMVLCFETRSFFFHNFFLILFLVLV